MLARPLRLTLFVIDAQGYTAHPLPSRGLVTLGRARTSDVWLRDRSIARTHALLEAGSTLRLMDGGSGARIVVRDRPLAAGGAIAIAPGEPFRLGALTLVVRETPRRDALAGVPPRLVGDAPATRELRELAAHVGRSTMPVLVTGEAGVGKHVVAYAVHRESARRRGPLVRVDGTTRPAVQLERALFGYERGVVAEDPFAAPGLLEHAHGGTLLLARIDAVPRALHVRLLRAWIERASWRVGANRPRPLDVRVLATSRRAPDEASPHGLLRAWQTGLTPVPLTVLPLRARRADIAPLAQVFVADACDAWSIVPVPPVSHDVLALLTRYDWPGNARSLRDTMERAVLLCRAGETLAPWHLPTDLAGT